jgi:hypothetical protein
MLTPTATTNTAANIHASANLTKNIGTEKLMKNTESKFQDHFLTTNQFLNKCY